MFHHGMPICPTMRLWRPYIARSSNRMSPVVMPNTAPEPIRGTGVVTDEIELRLAFRLWIGEEDHIELGRLRLSDEWKIDGRRQLPGGVDAAEVQLEAGGRSIRLMHIGEAGQFRNWIHWR